MRILLGFANHIPQILQHRRLSGYDHDFLFFDHNTGHLKWSPDMSWNDISAACPGGPPDLYIHWSVEYNPLPLGIEHAECFTVGVFGDWNLGGRAIHAVKGMFDLWISDRPGSTILKKHGLQPAATSLLWAQHPTTHLLTNPPSSKERDIDILLIGNLNHDVQYRRAPLLARIARLSSQYKVVIATGVYGSEYTALMNRAKIVFNHSIRGEANMRAFEGPACGALTFNEIGNTELSTVFVNRKTHVEYTADNLEPLLHYYLDPANAREREEIAEAGHQLVTNHSYADHLRRLLDRILPEYLSWQQAPQKSGRSLLDEKADKTINVAKQWLTCLTPASIPLAYQLCDRVNTEEYRLLNCRVLCEWARFAQSPSDQSKLLTESLNGARELAANHPLSTECALVWAASALAVNNLEEIILVEDKLRQTHKPLFNGCYPPLMPRTMDEFDVVEDETWLDHADDPDSLSKALTGLMRARLLAIIAERFLVDGNLRGALFSAREASNLLPRSAKLHYLCGRCMRALGLAADGMAAFTRALEVNPFNWQCRTDAVMLALETQDTRLARELLDEWNAMIQAIPVYQHTHNALEQLQGALAQVEKQANQQQIPKHLMFIGFETPQHWHDPIVKYLQETNGGDNAMLLLRAEARPEISESAIHSAIAELVRCNGASGTLPHILVITQPIAPADRWKLFSGCSLVVRTPALSAIDITLAEFQNVPIVSNTTVNQTVAA